MRSTPRFPIISWATNFTRGIHEPRFPVPRSRRLILAAIAMSAGLVVFAPDPWTIQAGVFEASLLIAAVGAGAGWCVYVVAFVREHNARRRQLQISEERYQLLFDRSRDGILIGAPDGGITAANAAACALFGADEAELVRGGRSALFDPDQTGLAEFLEERARTGFARREMRMRRRDGSAFMAELSSSLSRVDDGEPQVTVIVRDISERQRAAEALAHERAQLTAIYEQTPAMMILLDQSFIVRRMNQAAERFSGRIDSGSTPQPGSLLSCLHALADPRGCGYGPTCSTCVLRRTIHETFATGASQRRVEFTPHVVSTPHQVGTTLLASTAKLVVDGESMVLLCLEDISEQRSLERQVRETQKLEELGQLAGGVAHDFNNILTATLLHLEISRSAVASADPVVADAFRVIEEQSRRAVSLTRQLLLFSRREVMHMHSLDVNELIDHLLKMIRRVLGEHIAVDFQSQPGCAWVDADAGMLDQVVTNLCVNARDAMPAGGTLTLRTATIALNAAETHSRPATRAGRFVRLTVSDTGCGMDEATRARIFEPFFTTKEAGKGTGLGLATVFGIVKQHQGWIEVQSEPGRGSAFAIYLPACATPPTPHDATSLEPLLPRGQESVLLVEDEPAVRRATARLLRSSGYLVTEAGDGNEALQLAADKRWGFDLLLTDMVMPGGLSGLDLAAEVRTTRPKIKLVLTSGYSAELVDGGCALPRDAVFVPKPATGRAIIAAVRAALDLQP